MLIFIDDSGDPGFKINKGSSTHFVIAMVIFHDHLEAEKTAITIKELKREFKMHPASEFKFSKSRKEIKTRFLIDINSHDFDIRCLVVDKKIVRSSELKNNRDKFYGYFIKEALKQNKTSIINANIKIDGGGDRIFRKSFMTYLRKELNNDDTKLITNCKLVDSKKNVLVQLADMIAGSINRSYSSKSDSSAYKAIIRKHIKDEWKFR